MLIVYYYQLQQKCKLLAKHISKKADSQFYSKPPNKQALKHAGHTTTTERPAKSDPTARICSAQTMSFQRVS